MKYFRCLLIIFSLILGGASGGMAQDNDKDQEAAQVEVLSLEDALARLLQEIRILAEQGNVDAQSFLVDIHMKLRRGMLMNRECMGGGFESCDSSFQPDEPKQKP